MTGVFNFYVLYSSLFFILLFDTDWLLIPVLHVYICLVMFVIVVS